MTTCIVVVFQKTLPNANFFFHIIVEKGFPLFSIINQFARTVTFFFKIVERLHLPCPLSLSPPTSPQPNTNPSQANAPPPTKPDPTQPNPAHLNSLSAPRGPSSVGTHLSARWEWMPRRARATPRPYRRLLRVGGRRGQPLRPRFHRRLLGLLNSGTTTHDTSRHVTLRYVETRHVTLYHARSRHITFRHTSAVGSGGLKGDGCG